MFSPGHLLGDDDSHVVEILVVELHYRRVSLVRCTMVGTALA
jgi:hypothetical protein